MDLYCHPLDRFGPLTEHRGRSGYGAKWSTTITELQTEAMALGADEVLILLALDRSQIRVDGWPKSGVDVPPQVAVSFASVHGPLRFECDRWNAWRDNVRAIGLTLTRLRLIDEGGVARSGEQYRGWQAIGAGPAAVGAMTYEEAGRFLVERAAGVRHGASPEELYRAAAKLHHPDVGGDPDTFRRLTEARDLLLAGRT